MGVAKQAACRTGLARALRDRRGAVTVDWVVLAAAVVVLAFGIVSSLSAEFEQIWDDMFVFVSDNTGF